VVVKAVRAGGELMILRVAGLVGCVLLKDVDGCDVRLVSQQVDVKALV
jgi:hypothetical protein